MAVKYIPFLLIIGACTSENKTDDTSTTNEPATDTEQETGDTFPPKPSFSLATSGGETMDLSFDEPTCTSQVNSGNLRIFWRTSNNQHVFVLVAELLGTYDGVGSYNQEAHRAKIKLQEEAGGMARYYATSSDDEVTITIDYHDEDGLYGTAQTTTLHGTNGDITLSPDNFPLWCDEIVQ